MAEALIAGHCPRCAAACLVGVVASGAVVLLDPDTLTYVVPEGASTLVPSAAHAVHRCHPTFAMG